MVGSFEAALADAREESCRTWSVAWTGGRTAPALWISSAGGEKPSTVNGAWILVVTSRIPPCTPATGTVAVALVAEP
jgi:hypothetical protein